MDQDQFESYDKEWYVLQKSSLKEILTAQCGSIQIYEQGVFTKKKLLFIGDIFKPLPSYAPLFKALYDDFYIMSYDLYGQGKSERDPNSKYDFDIFVEQFRVVLTHFGISSTEVHIVAQGFGCTILAGYLCYQRENNMPELNIVSVTLISPTGVCPKLMQTYKPTGKSNKSKKCLYACTNPDDMGRRAEQYRMDLHRRSYQYFSLEQKTYFAYNFNNILEDVPFFEYIWQNNVIVQPEKYQAFQQLPTSISNRLLVLEQDEYNNVEELVQFFADNLPEFNVVDMERSRSEVASLEPTRLANQIKEGIAAENEYNHLHTVSLDLK